MKLLIAYDSSDCADAMFDDLLRAGLPREAEVVVMAVAEWMPTVPPLIPLGAMPGTMMIVVDPLTLVLDAKREVAQAACGRLQDSFPAWRLSAAVATGSPATALLQRAEDWQPDLLVAGSHGYTVLGRFFFGSVSQKLITGRIVQCASRASTPSLRRCDCSLALMARPTPKPPCAQLRRAPGLPILKRVYLSPSIK
jgi:nucleotide-binding universal stress UspA family protein